MYYNLKFLGLFKLPAGKLPALDFHLQFVDEYLLRMVRFVCDCLLYTFCVESNPESKTYTSSNDIGTKHENTHSRQKYLCQMLFCSSQLSNLVCIQARFCECLSSWMCAAAKIRIRFPVSCNLIPKHYCHWSCFGVKGTSISRA